VNYIIAKKQADEVVYALAPYCSRIEIAGSIRREKQDDIKDIEVVCISKRLAPTFGGKPVLPLHHRLDVLRLDGIVRPRLDKLGREAWGLKFRRALWNDTPLDIFIVTPETWGVLFAIRTGNADFSHLLVSPRSIGGAMPDGYFVKEGRLYGDGLIETPEEESFFSALGLDWIEPRNRTPETLKMVMK